MQFEWDPDKERINIEKHSGYNKYGDWEDRYITIGLVHKVLYVVYTVRVAKSNEIIRMISARAALPKEREKYIQWWESQV